MFSDKVIALDASSALNTTETFSSVLSILRSEIRSAKSLAMMIKLILDSLRTVCLDIILMSIPSYIHIHNHFLLYLDFF